MNIFKNLAHIKRDYGGGARKLNRVARLSFIHSSPDASVEVHSQEQDVVIALGSNVGDRLHNFEEALSSMKNSGIQITRHSCLYETAPAYVTDQPYFLNSAVKGTTKLGPLELLGVLKKIEKDMGRTGGIRYGPRPIDLDILFYGKCRMNSETLTIPHERIWERPFVMAPLIDLLGFRTDNEVEAFWHLCAKHCGGLFESWKSLGGESLIGKDGMKRVLPIGSSLWDWSERTWVMGILNLTPDSFSDGGKHQSVDSAVSKIRLMLSEGADVIDLGAQSTRPMASRITAEEELERLIPVLEAVKEMPEAEGKLFSVDTFYSKVAIEAVREGACLINDVSSGQLDPSLHGTIAGLKVPYAMMHMRGDPKTMQSSENLKYKDVCKEVAAELCAHVRDAELSGIPAWRIMIDPGFGFSKTTEHNLDILMGLSRFRDEIAQESIAMSHAPLLVGPSRKRFLGEVCSRSVATDRDPATVAAVTAAILGGANIVRVHNVKDNVDAAKLCDAMLQRRRLLT